MKQFSDRPYNGQIKNMERMIAELSPYITEMEMDKCVDFMVTIQHSKYDINPSVEDSKSQMKLILGSLRYEEVVLEWTMKNQKLLTAFGTRKYINKNDKFKTQYDGLDDTDDPKDFEVIYV